IQVPWPHCKRNLKAGPNYFGRRVACTFCNQVFHLSPYIQSPCPHCKRTLQIRPEYIDRSVQCNHCKQLFRFQLPSDPANEPTSELRQEEQQRVKAKNRALRKRVRSLEADIKRVVKALDARSAEHSIAIEQLRDAQAKLPLQPAPAGQPSTAPGPQVEALRQQLADAQAEQQRLRGQIQTLENQVSDAVRLREQVQHQSAEIERMRNQLRQAEAELSHKSSTAIADAELEAVRRERDQLQQELSGLRDQLA